VSEETLRELAKALCELAADERVDPFSGSLLKQSAAALRSSAVRVEELQSQLSEATKPVTDDRVPICGSRGTLTVSRAIWDEAWHAYGKQYGFTDSQHKRLLREGFYAEELDTLRPGWRPVDQALERLAREKAGANDTVAYERARNLEKVTRARQEKADAIQRAEAAERRCQAYEKDSKRYRWLIEQCGYVQDGSDQTVGIFQDDATRCWHVRAGSKHYGEDNRSLDSVIDAALLVKPE
jgi:hypothetical protein